MLLLGMYQGVDALARYVSRSGCSCHLQTRRVDQKHAHSNALDDIYGRPIYIYIYGPKP